MKAMWPDRVCDHERHEVKHKWVLYSASDTLFTSGFVEASGFDGT